MSLGLVVGAGGGIGSACARALDGSVDLMVLAGRSESPLRAVATTLRGGSEVVLGDIATAEGRETIAASGRDAEIAWVILASGVPLRGAFPDLAPTDIEATFLTNLVGPALLVRHLLDRAWQPSASIIAIGSISASRSLPNRAAYSGSKAGLEHLCRSLAAEVAPRGIRVNVVSPGVVDTPFLGGNQQALQTWVSEHVPQRRLATPEDVAGVVRYLVLDAPTYVTGARIAVDGGAESIA